MPAFDPGLGPRILEEIRRRVSETQYHTWFDRIEIRARGGGVFEILTPTSFHRSFLTDRYESLIEDAIREVASVEGPRLEFSEKPLEPTEKSHSPSPPEALFPEAGPPLRPEFTFDRFIPGPTNRFAFAAARAVSEQPGQQYNPLFLHGSVGLGKTHLLQAIGRQCVESGVPRVIVISCAEFTDDFIASIADRKTESFREKYRRAGALLIDDIHFLEAKNRTQEEFFHTFNELTNLGRQIVLTSDSPPSEIAGLSERLVSRFKRGLVAQLSPPELETREAIVLRKGRDLGLEIPQEVAELVAKRVCDNVRELEGAVLRLHSRVHLEQIPLDRASAQEALGEIFGERTHRIDLPQVQHAVLEEFDVKSTDIHSRKRTRSVVVPRQVCMYLARRHTGSSLGEIGIFFGGRDHTTVLHAVQKIERLREADRMLRRRIDSIESILLR